MNSMIPGVNCVTRKQLVIVTGVEGTSAIMKPYVPWFTEEDTEDEVFRDLLMSYSSSLRTQSLSISVAGSVPFPSNFFQ